MSELMISPTPTPSPSEAGSAKALSQSNAASQSGENTKANTESGTGSPFAAALKSQVDKKTAASEVDNKPNTSAATAQADTESELISIDLSALFPFLGASAAETTSVDAVPQAATEQAATAPDEKLIPALQPALQPELEPATSPPPTQVLTALPSVPTAGMDTGPRKLDVGTKEGAFTSADRAIPGQTTQASGKIAPDAAITAEVSRKSGENSAPELPVNDFHALMERAVAPTPSAATGSTASPSLRIDIPLGQAGWHDEVGQKLTWMVGNSRQQADLVLNPPQLGRVEVSLTMNGDQASAIFTSSNPAVREALENSLHRLREVLADAGVSLGQTHVGSESPHQSSPGNKLDFGGNEGVRYASTIPLPGVTTVTRTGAGRSMIDIFA
ncbi:MAG: flagellar hook-length control protein FliK [Sulfuritalea sp.]|jgi:flagellar hook-length control protein FliK|nr:flagellar hook-length control protein FliK [Sulfuritalea sp.]